MSFDPELPIFKYANAPVPTVLPEDLRKLSEICREMRRRYPEGGVSVDLSAYENIFSPGADPIAVWLRSSLVGILEVLPGRSAVIKEDAAREPVPDYIFEVISRIALIGPPLVPGQAMDFDAENLLKELERARAAGLSESDPI
jgi:hypothetical protein